jgi:hypothetical protein
MSDKKLSLIYDKRQKDFVVKYPQKADGALSLHHLVGDILQYKLPDSETNYPYNWTKFNFIQELEKRGYDITTLRFSIEKKATCKNTLQVANKL